MVEYVCYGCNECCVHEDSALREMDILVGGEVYDTICPYCGFYTEFVRRDGKDDPDEDEEESE